MRSTERSTQHAPHQALALNEALTIDGAASPFLLGHSSPSVADSYNPLEKLLPHRQTQCGSSAIIAGVSHTRFATTNRLGNLTTAIP